MKAWWIVPVLTLVPATVLAQQQQQPPPEQTMPAQPVNAQPDPNAPPPPQAQVQVQVQTQPGQGAVYYQQQPPPPGYGQQPAYYPQPGYGQQPVYYAPPVARGRRGGIDYAGGPVPPGMHVEGHRSRGLIAGGAVLFAVPYLISLVVAAYCSGSYYCAQGQGWLYAPGVGPFIAALQPGVNSTSVSFLVIDGILQLGGLGMLIAGVAHSHDVLVYGEDNHHRDAHRFAWSIIPSAPGAAVGLTFSAMNF